MELTRPARIALVLSLTAPLVSCSRNPPDRTNLIQLPLVALVLVLPALSFEFKRRDSGLEVISLVCQIIAYLAYETGVSIDSNIRSDLLFMYPAIALNVWIVLGELGRPKARSEVNGMAPGVSIAPGRARCDVCGKIYPSHEDIQIDGSGRHVCDHCRTS